MLVKHRFNPCYALVSPSWLLDTPLEQMLKPSTSYPNGKKLFVISSTSPFLGKLILIHVHAPTFRPPKHPKRVAFPRHSVSRTASWPALWAPNRSEAYLVCQDMGVSIVMGVTLVDFMENAHLEIRMITRGTPHLGISPNMGVPPKSSS